MPARPERIRIGVLTFATRERAQNLVARHVGEVQVEQDDVVVVELAEVDALLAEIRRVDVEVLGFEHQLDDFARWRCRPRSEVRACQVPSPLGVSGMNPPPAHRACATGAPFDPTRNANEQWLTNPDSGVQGPAAETLKNWFNMLRVRRFRVSIQLTRSERRRAPKRLSRLSPARKAEGRLHAVPHQC